MGHMAGEAYFGEKLVTRGKQSARTGIQNRIHAQIALAKKRSNSAVYRRQ